MDLLLTVAVYAFGFISPFVVKALRKGTIEGNRQDYTIKIGLLKKEREGLLGQLAHGESLLRTANEDCHRLQQKILQLSHENERLTTQVKDLNNQLYKANSGLQLLTR